MRVVTSETRDVPKRRLRAQSAHQWRGEESRACPTPELNGSAVESEAPRPVGAFLVVAVQLELEPDGELTEWLGLGSAHLASIRLFSCACHLDPVVRFAFCQLQLGTSTTAENIP
jgi:hypothetical protein